MEFRSNEKGFTLYSLLFTLTIMLISIPLLGTIFQTLHEKNYYDEISIQQVFYFIQQDAVETDEYYIENNKIHFTLNTGEIVTIEKYGSLIRRQVDGQGHEIYLRDIQEFQVRLLDYGFQVYIRSNEGEKYEKTIVFFS